MDPELYNAARSGDVDFLQSRGKDAAADLLSQKTPKKSSILHIAAEFNQLEFFKLAVGLCPLTLLHANTTDDTALHFAAREGSTEVVEFIINYAKQKYSDIEEGRAIEGYKELLRIVNRDGDNALHLAAQYGHYEVAKLLVEADPELSNYDNKAGQSTCFMATVREYTEIVELLLGLNNPPCSLRGGANGTTALHAAVLYEGPPKGIAMKIVNARPEMIRECDAIGWTPFHYAACLGKVDEVEFFLKHDPSTSYLVGNEGESALHIAAFNGHIKVIEDLISTCPDCWDLLNNKGQTPLHAAVLGGKVDVVEFILGFSGLNKSIGHLADNDGNTVLHLAAMCENKAVMASLCKGKNSYERSLLLNAANKQNLTALDIYEDKVVEGLDIAELEETIDLQHRHENAIYQMNKTIKNAQRLIAIVHREAHEDSIGEDDKANDLKLFELTATLIATVTFAAGFTMPGGFSQTSGPNKGMAVLASEKAFQAFVIFDIIAFFMAISVVLLQLDVSTIKYIGKKRSTELTDFELTFLSAFLSMGLAFSCGMYVVLARSGGFGLAALILPTFFIVAFYYYLAFLWTLPDKFLKETSAFKRVFIYVRNYRRVLDVAVWY